MVENTTERRLAAILAADVVGYSRLIERDEAGTLAALRELRKSVLDPSMTRHHGRIVKVMGDGVLVEFGSAVNAVACAVELQRQFAAANEGVADDRRVVLRVGVNLGDVVVEGGDLYGDGVIIAVRLETMAEPGGICISGGVHEQVTGKLEAAFDDLGLCEVKNSSKPVRVFRVRPGGDAAPVLPALALPDKPSIAVLPFQNMSGDPEQEYFSDGMVEEIITALSRMKWLFVIARNSSFTYKGRAVDVKQVGRELGVRYVLEGSVRKAGSRVRITGQLIDAATGVHIWAERFDGALEDIFELQDRVTSSVVGALAPKLEQAEIERAARKPTESLDAYDCYLRGMAAAYSWTLDGINEALRMFGRAIAIDPRFASAYGMAALILCQRRASGWTADQDQEVAETARLARRAMEFGKSDAVALAAAGIALAYVVHNVEDGDALIEQALALNSNYAWAWHFSGWVKVWRGEPETALERAMHAIRLSPQDPNLAEMLAAVAFAHFMCGRDQEGLTWAKRALHLAPDYPPVLRIFAASSAFAGEQQQAENAITRLRELHPDSRISSLPGLIPLRRPEDLARLAEGLRKAGLPE